MQKTNGELIFIVTTIVVVLLVITMVTLFIVFSRRKDKLLLEQRETKKKFEREIAETQIEIREETLKNISWELHDNIGQLLTLAKIQLQSATKENINEVSETIGKSLSELRLLSKLINPDAIREIKLKKAIQLEIDRFNRLNFIKSELTVTGKERDIDEKAGTVMFRIIQEFFSNTIKHSRATTLSISMNFLDNELQIIAKDNGVGFTEDEVRGKGIGLQNMKNRAELIGAKANLTSEIGEGTTLTINYKI